MLRFLIGQWCSKLSFVLLATLCSLGKFVSAGWTWVHLQWGIRWRWYLPSCPDIGISCQETWMPLTKQNWKYWLIRFYLLERHRTFWLRSLGPCKSVGSFPQYIEFLLLKLRPGHLGLRETDDKLCPACTLKGFCLKGFSSHHFWKSNPHLQVNYLYLVHSPHLQELII